MQFTTSEIIVLLFCAITLIVSVVTLITVLTKDIAQSAKLCTVAK